MGSSDLGTITAHDKPRIIPRLEHGVAPSAISGNALQVMRRLKSGGYQAYLVGGGIRDLLLGIAPKDFDVVTDAHPEQIKALFRNCRLIGRRFRLAHVRLGRELVEVSTFRARHQPNNANQHIRQGRIIYDNVYGTLEEDVWRRDFTVNALYYDISDASIIDYAGGVEDLRDRQMKLIGQAEQRYREDPARMLRAVRLSSKLGFSLHPKSRQPLHRLAPLLKEIPRARLFEECIKSFTSGHSEQIYHAWRECRLFPILFPQTEALLRQSDESVHRLLLESFKNTDERIAKDEPVSPGFLLASLLWTPVQERARENQEHGMPRREAMDAAMDAALSLQLKHTSIPRRYTDMTRGIWDLQAPLTTEARVRRPGELLERRYFRAAYDFLLLRARTDASLETFAARWTEAQEGAAPRQTRRNGRYRRRRRQRPS